jgi:hypothetical protein
MLAPDNRVHSFSMRRGILFAVLSFLLLAMQNESMVHPFGHLDTRVARPGRTEATLPHVVAACAECALLAAGSDAVRGDVPALQFPAPATQGALTAFHTRAVDAPVHFASRAPPVLL